jgi:hypothetical protein
MIIGLQISSYAQIVNLGLAVFPEHITPSFTPLHVVPNSSSLTLDCQFWSHEPTNLPGNGEHFGNLSFGILEICHFDAVQLSRV